MSTHRCIMTISLYRFTGAELGKLKRENHAERHIYKFLPTYCLRDDNRIDYTESWLQFVDDGKEEYLLFEKDHTEEPLAEEVSSLGLEWLSEDGGIDFGFLRQLPAIRYERWQRSLNGNIQLVFDVTYSRWEDRYSGGYEVDMEIDLAGYFNGNKELVTPATGIEPASFATNGRKDTGESPAVAQI